MTTGILGRYRASMWPFSQPPQKPCPPQDLAAILEVMLVKKLEAEARLEEARLASHLREIERRAEVRAATRARAIFRNKTLPRKNGRLQSARSIDTCPLGHADCSCSLCYNINEPHITLVDIDRHRSHSRLLTGEIIYAHGIAHDAPADTKSGT